MTASYQQMLPTARGPLVGAPQWREVIGAAGGRCQCTGGCGGCCSKPDLRRKNAPSWDGRCLREHQEQRPLAAVPARPVPWGEAVQLSAAEMIAVCDLCQRGTGTVRRREERKQADARKTEAPSLFPDLEHTAPAKVRL